MSERNITLTFFKPADQDAVRALILAGLAGHFGELDPSLNPDLDDIGAHYAGADFIVARSAAAARGESAAAMEHAARLDFKNSEGTAPDREEAEPQMDPPDNDKFETRRVSDPWQPGEIVGCGALVPRDTDTGEIVRMSVSEHCRRQGIGRLILDALCASARERGMKQVVLETTSSWQGVRRFYEEYGFELTGYEQHAHEHQAHYRLLVKGD